MTLQLRPATTADSPAVRAMITAVLIEYGLPPVPDSTDSDLFDLQASYHARGGRFDVLCDQHGQILGSVGLLPVGEHSVELRKMFLAAQARGQGHGRRLLEHALQWARAQGYVRMELETASVLVEAVALYRAYGFTPYTPAQMTCRCDQAHELQL